MASQAKMTIRVSASRGASTVSFTSNGRYVSFTASGYQRQLLGQAIQPTTSLDAFWASVLAIVQGSLTANPAPP
jgi:hypothetical protein